MSRYWLMVLNGLASKHSDGDSESEMPLSFHLLVSLSKIFFTLFSNLSICRQCARMTLNSWEQPAYLLGISY
jgi:hypothetical protein